jgi:hypothetical protein
VPPTTPGVVEGVSPVADVGDCVEIGFALVLFKLLVLEVVLAVVLVFAPVFVLAFVLAFVLKFVPSLFDVLAEGAIVFGVEPTVLGLEMERRT